MATGSGDIFPIPNFRFADESGGIWCQAVLNHLAKENPSMAKSQRVGEAFNKLTTLRRLIASVCNEETQPTDNRLTEGFIQGPLKEYVQLLHYAQSHMNLSSGSIKNMTFGWKTINGSRKVAKVSSGSAGFEYASMLSVAANCYIRIAQREITINGVEGAKNAFKYFQNAAGLYQHIGQRYLRSFNSVGKEQNAELTAPGNEQMVRLALAYAHHAAFIKAEAEMPTKYGILSKLAMEGSNAYASLAQIAKRYSAEGKCLFRDMPLDIEDGATFTSHVLKGKANFFLAQEFAEKQAFGGAIGRCNKALDALNLAHQLASSSAVVSREQKAWLQQYRAHVDQFADKAVHENSTLYFDRVQQGLPDPDPSGRPFGKPIPFDQIYALSNSAAEAKTNDPFFGIIPVHVLKTVTDWKLKMRETVKNISESVAAHKARTQSKLQTFGIHAAIQVASSETQDRGKMPADLRCRLLKIRGVTDAKDQLEYSESVNGTALDDLVGQIDHINNVLTFCRDMIAAIEGKFDAEEHEDAVKREAYGAKVWGEIRKPLREHPDGKAILFSLNDFKSALVKEAEEPLERAKQLLQANLREAMMIDWPLGDINKLMPFTETTEAQQCSEATQNEIKALQKILKAIESNDEDERVKLADLREIGESDEIAHLLSSTPFEQHQEVLDQARKGFNDRLSLVTALMNDTDRQVEAADTAMTNYATLQSTDGITQEVQEVCNKIIEALNVYEVVAQDISTIGKFCDTVSDQIENTSKATDSLILTRTIEADELVSNLDQQVAQKIAEMDRQTAAKEEAERSKRKQEELKAQLEWLEKERLQGNVYNASNQQYGGGAASSGGAASTASPSGNATTTASPAAAPQPQPQQQQYGGYQQQPPPQQYGGYQQQQPQYGGYQQQPPPPQQQQQYGYQQQPQQQYGYQQQPQQQYGYAGNFPNNNGSNTNSTAAPYQYNATNWAQQQQPQVQQQAPYAPQQYSYGGPQ